MAGAQSIMTGAIRVGAATVKTAPGLTQLKRWSRNASRLIPTAGYMCSTVLPTVLSHLWSVKRPGASPALVLPKVMPDNVRGVKDMEQPPPAEPVSGRGARSRDQSHG
jgi:hypothetical protein